MCENLKEVSESLGRIEDALKKKPDFLSGIKSIPENTVRFYDRKTIRSC